VHEVHVPLQGSSVEESNVLFVHAALLPCIRHQKLSLSEMDVVVDPPHMAVAVGGLARLLAVEFALTLDDAVHLISIEARGLELT
jgi:hypothetical protein